MMNIDNFNSAPSHEKGLQNCSKQTSHQQYPERNIHADPRMIKVQTDTIHSRHQQRQECRILAVELTFDSVASRLILII
jgi:hypothetical protein